MEQEFSEFSEFGESDKSLNLKILPLTSVLLVLW